MTLHSVLDTFCHLLFPFYDAIVTGSYCTVCDTVHGPHCPREVRRWCMDCLGFRVLDRYFRCSTCRGSSLLMALPPDDYRGAWRETLRLDGSYIAESDVSGERLEVM